MKTPEQMAEEFAANKRREWDDYVVDEAKAAFLAGYQAAKDEMNSSNNSNGWISVKERLPNLEKTSRSLRRESSCILLVSYGNVYAAHLCEDWSDRSLFIFEACTCNCRAFDMDIDEWKLDQVTHWMPLPETPKEEG
jgi:hypothetical protein